MATKPYKDLLPPFDVTDFEGDMLAVADRGYLTDGGAYLTILKHASEVRATVALTHEDLVRLLGHLSRLVDAQQGGTK